MRFLPPQQDSPRVNLTPLIDVVFLLLIFLMVSTSFVDNSTLNIDLPQASEQAPPTEAAFTLSVSREGEYFLDGEKLDPVGLYPRLERFALDQLALGISLEALHAELQADAAAPHGAVVKAMDSLSRAGFGSVGIATLYNGANL
jgi:biopolymer transport protein ExbD